LQSRVITQNWEWAKNSLTLEILNNKFFLAKDIKGKTAWHRAAEKGKLGQLRNLCEWVRWP